MDEGDFELIPCKVCGRNFRSDVLVKHEPICLKTSRKQRKVFDSGKQRADGSDIPKNKTLKPGEIPKPDPKIAIAEAKTKQWRQKHNQLIESFQAARNYNIAKRTGGPLPPPPPPVIDTSLVECPYCKRRFNEDACNRHMPFCKEQQAKLAPRNIPSKKPLYKAPPLKSKQQMPTQKPVSVTPNGFGSQSSQSASISSQSTASRSGLSSNLPVKAAKTNLPTRSVVGRPQASPTINTNNQANTNTGNTRPGSYTNSGQRGPVKAATTQVAPSKTTPTQMAPTKTTALRKPVGGTNVNTKPVGFCHECGAPFSVASARFCSECGVRRLAV